MTTSRLRDVHVRLGGRTIIDAVDLDVPRGDVTAVVGGDGAGKSTLLRVLAGALLPDEGLVTRPSARATGYMPASSGTYADLTVAENIDFAATAYGVPTAVARRRTDAFLERTGLAHARDRLAGRLSGGMRQKLGVVRALVHEPELLILDEPTTGVDPVSRADLWWLVARAAAEGAAVVVATCYLDEASRASSLLVLDDGRTLTRGTVDEIVAAAPGSVRTGTHRPTGDVALRTWRRGGRWRTWSPEVGPPASHLEDAVLAMLLARRLEACGPVAA